jgi:general secretion pathway protein L
MQADVVIAVLKRWIEILARLVLAWREHRRSQRTLMISEENGALVVCQSGTDGRKAERKPKVLAGATARRVARSARGRFVILALSADKIVTRHLNVPAQAREFLAGIVRNQIERLSPWPAGDVMHGFYANAEHGGSLDIQVLMTSRASIEGARATLAAAGLQVDRIVARRPDTDATPPATPAASEPVTLWSRMTDAPQEDLATATRLIGGGIAAAVAWAVILSIFTLTMASSIRHESEELAARTKTLQRQLQAGRSPASMASLPAPQRAWLSKETAASSVIVLEALSRALPDSAHLAEVKLDGTTLRIIGNADDAPALLAPLEQSGHLSNVHFFAPTTRGPDGRQFRFHIEARVEPHIKIADEAVP